MTVKEKTLSLKLKNGESRILKEGNLKLIITYFGNRAKINKHNRDIIRLKKLEKLVKTSKLAKTNINYWEQ